MMNNTLSKILVFAAGAAVGSIATYVIVKAKCDKEKEEEIQSVIDTYDRLEAEKEHKKIVELNERVEAVKDKWEELNSEEEDENMQDEPYVITPEDVEESDYVLETLDWYEDDDTLVNQWGEVIVDRSLCVGDEFASHFGDYGERDKDTVYVRNDVNKVDYEILRNHGCYEEPED